MMRMAGYAIAALLPGWCALAQTPVDQRTIALGKEIYQTKAACRVCHHWDGSGNRESGGPVPSLRQTALSAQQVQEVVQCGRPTTMMPYHDATAYTDDRCYDATREDLGNATPLPGVAWLSPADLAAVSSYVVVKIKGRGAATLQECTEFWGTDSKLCDTFRK